MPDLLDCGLGRDAFAGPSRFNDKIVVGVREPAPRCRGWRATVDETGHYSFATLGFVRPEQHHDQRLDSSGVGGLFSDCPYGRCRCGARVGLAMAAARGASLVPTY